MGNQARRRRTGQNLQLQRRGDKIEHPILARTATDVECIGIGVQRQCIDLNFNRARSCARSIWVVAVLKVGVVTENPPTAEITKPDPNRYIRHGGSDFKQNSCPYLFTVP